MEKPGIKPNLQLNGEAVGITKQSIGGKTSSSRDNKDSKRAAVGESISVPR